jgi:hypothetical protein
MKYRFLITTDAEDIAIVGTDYTVGPDRILHIKDGDAFVGSFSMDNAAIIGIRREHESTDNGE